MNRSRLVLSIVLGVTCAVAAAEARAEVAAIATLKACFTQPEPWRCASPAVRGKGLQQVALITLHHGEGPDGTPLLVFAGNVRRPAGLRTRCPAGGRFRDSVA